MSYLRLIQDKMQIWAETVSSAIDVDVSVADKNLTRIIGTGKFYDKIDESCSEDSLFAKVINSGEPNLNLVKGNHCINCSRAETCSEFANMSYPIKIDGEVIGVLSFASFDEEQAHMMILKKDEYFNMLSHNAEMIEKEIIGIKTTNKLKTHITEVNEIINRINKGIIILNSKSQIIHINSSALKTLGINISNQKIIEANINNFIKNIKLQDTGNKDIIGRWEISEKEVRVMYSISEITFRDNEVSLMISFDEMQNIINIAKTYENKNKVFFENIIGDSKLLLESINKSKIAATTDSTILIQGASGTGKELFAKSIHNESLRKDGPFIAINCGSIPENLIESELFGYEKGSFTGASSSGKKGKIELANNGTLFLDEIGDLPLYLQTRLLRVLQERSIDKVGGMEPIDVNIRVISATNKNLRELIQEGKFRLDLFYRLNIIPINLPCLKDREDDIFLCSEYILEKLCSKMNKKRKELSNDVKQQFKNYKWQGNIRELENILEHGVCFSKDEYIKLEDLPDYFFDDKILELDDGKLFINENKTLEELKIEFEKSIISQLIHIHGDTVEGKKIVADKLNIGLTTLYRKMNSYDS
jgi:transcriptional regulator with PAS, ATPase and Fis domain